MVRGAHARVIVLGGAVLLGALGGWLAALVLAADLVPMALAGAVAGLVMGTVVDPEQS